MLAALLWRTLRRVVMAIDVDRPPPPHPPTAGLSTLEQWAKLPVLKRSMEWDAEGRLFVHEIKRDPATGLKVRIRREIVG